MVPSTSSIACDHQEAPSACLARRYGRSSLPRVICPARLANYDGTPPSGAVQLTAYMTSAMLATAKAQAP